MVFILALVGLIPASGRASYGADERRPPEPPQQAIDACKDQSEGRTVEMATPRGDAMKAVCRQIGAQLVAVPEGGSPSGNGGPPSGEPPAGGTPGGDPPAGADRQGDAAKGGAE